MTDYLNNMLKDDNNYEQSLENFKALENKFQNIISKCDKKNLQSPNQLITDKVKYHVQNTTNVEHYIVDDLHVYKIYSGMTPIDYWISSGPLYEPYSFTNSFGRTYPGVKNTNIPFFEYSCGGIKNGFPVDNVDKYSKEPYIGVCANNTNDNRLTSDIRATSGYKLTYSWTSMLGNYIGYKDDDNKKRCNQGDLFGFIQNLNPEERHKQLLEDLKSLLNKVNNLSLAPQKNKKNFLKALIGRNKDLSSKIDSFNNAKGR